ncbi:MAG: ABC transporter permease, partial [Bacillota bacterium]|nr:ABC transporter permease [Bacillota bacterium]
PLSAPSCLIREAMTKGLTLWQFRWTSLALATGLSLLYFILGWVFFGRQEALARRQGLIGQY